MYSERANAPAISTKPQSSRPGPYHRPRELLPYTPPQHDPSGKWGHDLFGAQVRGGNLAFRLGGTDAASAKIAARNGQGSGDLLDPGLDLFGKKQAAVSKAPAAPVPSGPKSLQARPPVEKKVPSGPGLGIKGASVNQRIVQVGNLAPGTTAEDVKMTFESFGKIQSASISSETRQSVSVLIEFLKPGDAANAIQMFNGQIADGRPISVKHHQGAPPPPSEPSASTKGGLSSRLASAPAAPRRAPAPGGLFGRLGLTEADQGPNVGNQALDKLAGGDLMDGIGPPSKMYSDSINDPRPAGQRGAPPSRGRKRGRGARSNRGVGQMDVD